VASRIRTLAAAVVTAINAGGTLPAGITAERVRSVTYLLAGFSTGTPGRVAVICPGTEDESDRSGVAETIRLSIVLVARCAAEAVASSDAFEDALETLCDSLRTSATYKTISLGGSIAAQRRDVSIVTTCDAQALDEQELFVGAIEASWFVSVGARA
jgi:hypothetical protein